MMMQDTWLELARDSRKAAATLIQNEHFRSVAARAYYAAYSKVSHELVLAGQEMPKDREGPSHRKLRPMVEAGLRPMSKEKRLALSEIIGRLYALRLYADYQPSVSIGAREAREALSLMKKVFDSF